MDRLHEIIESWNVHAFLIINSSAEPSGPWLGLARGLAEWPPFLIIALLIVLWVWGDPRHRAGLVAVTAGTALAVALGKAIQAAWFVSRPFAAGMGTQLLDHAADAAFPSDHVLFGLAVGFGLLAATGLRALGMIVVAAAIGMAWARIHLGIHYPLDMVGAAAIAGLGAVAARRARPWVERNLLALLNRIYGRMLRLLRVPRWMVAGR